jgi:hypothetical protein
MSRKKKAPPGMPLIFAGARSRVEKKVPMGAATWSELRKYLEWATGKTQMTSDEALVLVMDRALGDLFRADSAWQAEKDTERKTEAPTAERSASTKAEPSERSAESTVSGTNEPASARPPSNGVAAKPQVPPPTPRSAGATY